ARDLATGVVHRLARLGGDEARELLAARLHAARRALQDVGASEARKLAHDLEGGLGAGDGGLDLGLSADRHVADDRAVEGGEDRFRLHRDFPPAARPPILWQSACNAKSVP